MRRAWCVALLLAAGALQAQPAERGDAAPPVTAAPVDPPVPGEILRDRDFGVATRQFGLERRVEMFQWRRVHDRYERVWNEGVIDSTSFDPARANPRDMPLPSRRWWSQDATLDGHPLSPDALRVLGQWRTFRPGFSRLPANLAATFQPEGDGLSSSENPLQPTIGDLRVTWRELVLPPLDGRVALRDGAWHPVADAPRAAPVAPASAADPQRAPGLRAWWILAAACAVAVAIGWLRRRRRRA